MKESFISHSEEQTERIGARIGAQITRGLVALYGELGAGKTVFSRGFLRAKFPGIVVTSPSFTVMNQYGQGRSAVYHADLYRINSFEDLESTGFYDLPQDALILCEWAEKLPKDLTPDHRITIRAGSTPEQREILWESDLC